MFSIGTSERNSILRTFRHNSFVVRAFFFLLRQLCCSPVLCFVSIKSRSSTAKDSNAAKLTPIDPAVSSKQERLRKCMALITAVCLFLQIVLLLAHTCTCTHIDIHALTHTRLPLAHINNVRPSSSFFFFSNSTQLSACKETMAFCLSGSP